MGEKKTGLRKNGMAILQVNARLKDWVFNRSRYPSLHLECRGTMYVTGSQKYWDDPEKPCDLWERERLLRNDELNEANSKVASSRDEALITCLLYHTIFTSHT
ncbi:hypothetical protein AVEN_114614-1 [Araneus ventricosus]|uniref:Uncharacterized protein n=1 Tax=Araneus ventricosus TaxID=182803 RepID=A0A4Y2GAW8_ARAVE|nr:hypothetical protein AVEN_114614-1 [Araneus ventricosus]